VHISHNGHVRTRSRSPRSARLPQRRTLAGALLGTVALIASLVIATPAAASPGEPAAESAAPAAAASVVDAGIVKMADSGGFNPENIISDALFYDGNAMSSAEIQAFLDAKIGSCDNGKCLNVLTTSISSRDAWYSGVTGDLVCSALQGGTMRVSELIYRVQVACGISAKVILVTLQKEQGLTTSSAPSDWNLRAAMGASCPDTAPCDPAYSGVGPQIVQGVRQLKVYKAGRFGKQPGTNFIGYNPNSACGGTNLNIRNYATAALYNYTPYQPNAAALAAGWGLGDGCSSYGNRNFFNYYTSWFGSTQFATGGLYSVGPDIYLMTAGKRYHVTAADWPAFQAAFGSPAAVSAALLQGATTDGGDASRYFRNTSNSVVAYLDGGTTHRFASCTLVAAWGGACGSTLTDVGPEVFARLGSGSEMTGYARLTAGGRIHQMSGSTLIPYYDARALKEATGSSAPYAAVLSQAAASSYKIDRLRFGAGQLVRIAGDDRVWLVADGGRILYVPSFGVTADLGLGSTVGQVSSADLAGFAKSGTLSPVVTCSGQVSIAASGTLYRFADASGFTPSDVGAAACKALKRSTDAPQKIFVQAPGAAEVYILEGGVRRHVTSRQKLAELAGTSSARILSVTAGSLAQIPVGPAYLSVPAGTPIQGAGQAKVWLPAAAGLLHVPVFGVMDDLGIPRSSVAAVQTSVIASFPDAGVLSPVVSCGGVSYIAASGTLYPFADASGFTASDLGTAVCAVLTRSKDKPQKIFVQAAGTPEVYLLQNGSRSHVTSTAKLVALAGTATPRILTITAGSLAQFPEGPPLSLASAGNLIRGEGQEQVWLVLSGSRMTHVPSFGVTDDLGISRTSVITVPPSVVSSFTRSGELSPIVSCGGKVYLAAGGSLYPFADASGFSASALGTTVCGSLRISADAPQRIFVQVTGSPEVYSLEGGASRHVTSMAALIRRAGTASPRVLPVTAGTLAQLPTGSPIN